MNSKVIASPSPGTFEEWVSRVRVWTLIPLVFLPVLVGIVSLRQAHVHVSNAAILRGTGLIVFAAVIVWWIWISASRTHSVRAILGPLPDRAGWRTLALALFGCGCLHLIEGLVPRYGDLLLAARSGGAYTLTANYSFNADWFDIIVGVVIAPVGEELFFRGVLFRKWRLRWGPGKAALLSSLIFAIVHLRMDAHTFAMGLTCALAYTATRALWVPVLVHALNNASLHVWDWYFTTIALELRLDAAWKYGLVALVLLVGVAVWLQFVWRSWRTLGDPLPPDSLERSSVASHASLPDPVRHGC